MLVCVECGAPLSGSRRKFCSDQCRHRDYHRRFIERNGAHQATVYRRKFGRARDKRWSITCRRCGNVVEVTKATARYCSNRCAKADVRRVRLVHVGCPDPRYDLPGCHPARRPRTKVAKSWTILVAGPCSWCDVSFVGMAAAPSTLPMYCSTKCSRDAAKARYGKFRVSPTTRRAIYERDGHTCQLCHQPVNMDLGPSDLRGATLDHIVPRSLGGSDDPTNLRMAHRLCNSVRGAKEMV